MANRLTFNGKDYRLGKISGPVAGVLMIPALLVIVFAMMIIVVAMVLLVPAMLVAEPLARRGL
jgi:hypothetical protein